MHGGAFEFGNLDMAEADWVARQLAGRTAAVVVSVDYRLAGPGMHYPVALDECHQARDDQHDGCHEAQSRVKSESERLQRHATGDQRE